MLVPQRARLLGRRRVELGTGIPAQAFRQRAIETQSVDLEDGAEPIEHPGHRSANHRDANERAGSWANGDAQAEFPAGRGRAMLVMPLHKLFGYFQLHRPDAQVVVDKESAVVLDQAPWALPHGSGDKVAELRRTRATSGSPQNRHRKASTPGVRSADIDEREVTSSDRS